MPGGATFQSSEGAPASAIALIQARTGSRRLPGKVLRRYRERSVLERVVARARACAEDVLLCTSSDPSDDAIEAHAAEIGVRCVRGPLEDVFTRFRLALATAGVPRTPWFFRITADCPLLSPALGRALLEAAGDECDYLYVPDDELPRGLAPELVRRVAFERIDAASLSCAEREHVTLVFERPEYAARRRLLAPPLALRHPELRLTLDYPEDERVLRRLWDVDDEISAEEAVDYLLAHPEIAAENGHRRNAPVVPVAEPSGGVVPAVG